MTIALVTGANKGIGREIAAQLAERGLTVLLAARNKELGEKAAAELGVRSLVLDVTDPASVRNAAERIDEEFGHLDVLINNAGISGDPAGQRPGHVEIDVVRSVLETNVLGVIAVTEAMLPLLRRSSAARIVNVSSAVGSLGTNTDPDHYFAKMQGSAAYAPSKAALNMLTVQYAKALRPDGILVNSVTPGACDTDFTKPFARTDITRTAADGAVIAVQMATLKEDGPTSGFFDDNGTVPW
ncbi:SDR family NAD(P)-dependent oxidoreductase [Actinomadura barringtoniae]|uniref:SDR family NAD(P)-dependent oxidoreductase n=1 Tax=Actinomadura barringtoniae TaxID=1427535 RepID=A0A939PE81_9ACTN|nr:SDR family NAD(P)-dependent oxidoreductase [Actinomadura barringtoniae]MBO2450971.1 SDR family NAD(P)-dependent oxidoreductase [Actinomadura barringtoniae]